MTTPNPIKHTPNIITLANLLAGCLSIVSAFEGNLLLAGYLILLAAIFDYFDGFTARLLKAYSPLGKELDSLADLVSFGVAPSVLLFHLLRDSLNIPATEGLTAGHTLLVIPFTVAIFSALRLAKFNIDTRQTVSFIGLPTPANAIFIVGLILGLDSPFARWFQIFTSSPTAIIALSLVLSALLVAPIPMFSLKVKSLNIKQMWRQHLLIALSLLSIFILGRASLTPIILLYILISIVGLIFKEE